MILSISNELFLWGNLHQLVVQIFNYKKEIDTGLQARSTFITINDVKIHKELFSTDSGACHQSNSHPTLFNKEEDLSILIDLESEKKRRY